MRLSYEGIGQWAATFAADHAEEGTVAKLSGNGAVSACEKGDAFAGVVLVSSRDGAACTMALGGVVTAAYTGAAPAVGWSGLSADGTGGVQTDGAGHAYRVVDVDTDTKNVTFVL